MGACACGGPTKEIQKHFIDDEELGWRSDAYNPRTSTLYNILRKTKEMIVLQPQGQTNKPFFANCLQLDTPDLKPQKIKTLIGSRRVILIGQFQAYRSTLLKSIQAASNSFRTYVLTREQVVSFLEEFPIFAAKNWQNQKTVTSQLPIMVINTTDIRHSDSHIRIYVHAANKKDMKIYRQIGIDKEEGVIPENSSGDIKQYYLAELIRRIGQIERNQRRQSGGKNNPHSDIILLHNPKLDPAILADIFTDLLNSHFGIPPQTAKIYLARSLPTSIVAPEEALEVVQPEEDSDRKKMTPIETFQKLFRKYASEAGKQKVERAYNLLNTLTTNIYSHSDEQMYRRVKRTTRQVNQLLNNYKAGKSLLEELGWKIEGQMWVNNIEAKYLKIFKTDFDLGYKLYSQGP